MHRWRSRIAACIALVVACTSSTLVAAATTTRDPMVLVDFAALPVQVTEGAKPTPAIQFRGNQAAIARLESAGARPCPSSHDRCQSAMAQRHGRADAR